ncbi:MAG: cation-translocating P-type ATPase [Deltaproteobacteria bacterium]|uniref:Cation-translocating P-type ATPase n=1 Tax=Candidatus Zymogenus saltonus TaxID=2844893 RepID=A0A9D8KEQ4_9DELT|nr:cation-translocating P-type ATPase [Candidatus Zymogenus saltonus]
MDDEYSIPRSFLLTKDSVIEDGHLLSSEEVFRLLGASPKGLLPGEAAARLARYGPNELKEKRKKHPLMMLFDQFSDFMIIILIAAAVIAGFIGEASDAIAIVVIVVLNAVIGFVQEYRAEKAMEALKKMASPATTVLRNGIPATVQSSDLVPGDVVVLEAGNIIPADLRLIEAVRLKVEEAALTGESLPVEKDTDPLKEVDIPLGDRRNMAYRGTFVAYGRGAGVVVATGMETEIGKIAAMLQSGEEVKTPLQKRLTRLGKKLAISVLVICAVVFSVGVARGEPIMDMLLTAISLAVAAIPEALPAVVTISLAISARKMVKQNVLIRKLPAVETLGSVTYICSDKTGTLTMNMMVVEEIYVDGRIVTRDDFSCENLMLDGTDILVKAMALSNDANKDKDGNIIGDPTEAALFAAAEKCGSDKAVLEKTFPRVAEIPFDSERKRMTTIHKGEKGGFISFTKGALEQLIEQSDYIFTPEGEVPIDQNMIAEAGDRMADDGLRTLGICMRRWDKLPDEISPETVESGLTILGIAGLMDPLREEAKDAVNLCRTAGIKPIMITGDHPLTASAVARRLGIMGEDSGMAMTGTELSGLSLEDFEKRVEDVRVYARVAPEQKLKIIKGLQDKGQYVAMTGDGVNDAPALRRADIGVAMGITGTDVSKEAAHMILLDDNFATIVKAVKEGRRIFDNIRKFIRYSLTSNSGEIWTLFLAPILGLPIPLLPIHILWINLVTDGLPGLALAVEPAEKEVMQRLPRHPQESIFAHGLGIQVIWVGLLMGIVCLATQAWSIKMGDIHWQTMVFTILCFSQLGLSLAIRSERESFFVQGIFTNKLLIGALVFTVALQLATIYVPFLNPIFHTAPLTLNELAITLILSSVVFAAVEIEKLVRRIRRHPGYSLDARAEG